ncbi:hypothetical protein THAOC_00344 [Thalassiosira oceanica]|uniref:Uncharacterized protein n=1 Tax=Thalassiosira oceanica TaxID=159749 RepID=K0TJF3_THAOC|nr:hypothetical protein THAOC_00344 [Thalassiosira oceanica]|eukprot:EJK77800.1 hypothetical protein THAOC_00344 [Thalassiosira oceanica]
MCFSLPMGIERKEKCMGTGLQVNNVSKAAQRHKGVGVGVSRAAGAQARNSTEKQGVVMEAEVEDIATSLGPIATTGRAEEGCVWAVKIMNSRSGTAACIGRAGWSVPLAAPAPSLPLPAGGRGRPPDTTGHAVPLTGFPKGGSGGEGSRPGIAAAHRPGINVLKGQDQTTPVGTTLPSSPKYDSQ